MVNKLEWDKALALVEELFIHILNQVLSKYLDPIGPGTKIVSFLLEIMPISHKLKF